MSYSKQTWTNNVSSIDEIKMNHIEDGIYANSLGIESTNEEIADIKEDMQTISCCTAGGDSNITSTDGSTRIKLPLTLFRHRNDEGFEIQDGGIKMPYTGTVLVTIGVMMSPRTGYAGIHIVKGNSVMADAFFPAGTQTYGIIETANRPVDVNKGDILYFNGMALVGNTFQMGSTRSRMTVMYITKVEETE